MSETRLDVYLPDEDRRFCVIRGGRRWTRVPEYMTNGQLTARFFVDEQTGEARPARSWSSPAGYCLGVSASNYVRGIIAAADAVDRPTRRDHPEVGHQLVEEWHEEIERAIARLEWEDCGDHLPFSQGYVVKLAIETYGCAPSRVALHGTVRIAPKGEWEHYALCGLECEYSNARIRVYLLDLGDQAIPVLIDVWEREAEAA